MTADAANPAPAAVKPGDVRTVQAAPVQAVGVPVTAEVARGDPARTIAAIANRRGSGLIVFGTHGRLGLSAFWTGGVAPEVADRTAVPILLIRSAVVPPAA